MVDMVNKPPHYTRGGIECIEALASATNDLQGIEAVCTANAIKYLWRWKHKNGVEDLRKARWYLPDRNGHDARLISSAAARTSSTRRAQPLPNVGQVGRD